MTIHRVLRIRTHRARLISVAVAAVLAAGVVPAAVVGRQPIPSSGSALLRELGSERIARHAATGQVRFVWGTAADPAATAGALGHPATPREAADRFMARYGTLFGIPDAARDLRADRVIRGTDGRTVVRYQQLASGVPVVAGQLLVQVDGARNVISANGEASVAARVVGSRPGIAAAAAGGIAREAIAKIHAIPAAGLQVSGPVLSVYDPALLGGPAVPGARLVWRMDVSTVRGDVRELVLVDALHGTIALHFDQVADAKNRSICDADNTQSKVPCTSPFARVEGGAATGVADVDNAYLFSGHTYDFYFNRFGRDSLDGAGMALRSTVRYCNLMYPCPFQNAFWNGQQMVYGEGFASADDVVGHELTHGVTNFTSDLFYYYQSGAINEALSDIFGEFMDLTNGAGTDTALTRWQMGEDLPPSFGVIRDLQDPPLHQQPDRMQSTWYWGGTADQGGVHTNSGVANKAAYLMVDGDTFNGQTVAGIGIDKAAAIWYRVETNYLVSGSDYADLGTALGQACSDLIGTTPKQNDGSPSPSGPIAAADCTQVGKAVLATQMSLQPTVPDASAPEAPVCTTGTPSNVLYDPIGMAAPGWTVTGNNGNVYGWYYTDVYATSAPYALYGSMNSSAPPPAITRTTGTVIPAGAFLHFRHAYEFEYGSVSNWDGGVVEYSTDGGIMWVNASPLFVDNGPNGTITSGGSNPLDGQSAFVHISHGYTSSRLNLASLAGQTVRFRFRISSDSTIGWLGWLVDDFRIYTCGAPDTTPPAVGAPTADFRLNVAVGTSATPVSVRVKFTASDASGLSDTTLQQSVDAGPFTDVPLATATTKAANVSLAPSGTTLRQFRASAADAASPANVSGFSTAAPFKVKAIQNGSAALIQTGTWTTQSLASFYGGSVRYATAAGARQTLTKVMSDAAIVTTRGPDRGRMAVYVDDVLKATLDLYDPTTLYRRVPYVISFAGAPASHKIEIRALGTKDASSTGTRVDLDAVLLMTP